MKHYKVVADKPLNLDRGCSKPVAWLGLLLFAALIVAALAFLDGCSHLQARSPMAATIDANAATAALLLPQAQAVTIAEADAKTALANNAAVFKSYADAKTVNLLEYIFVKGKTILASGEYATRLDRASALSAETAKRATTQPAAWLNGAVAGECKVLIDVKNAKDGKESTP